MSNNDQGTRLHALDAIRAVALLSGIVLHSTLPYAPGIDPQLWPLKDSQQSIVMSVTLFLIHIFRMSVFFLVAGFFAHMLFHRRGTMQFLRNRAVRIVLPLVLGWLVCFVCLAGVVLWLLTKMNGGQMPSSLPPAIANAGLNFLHLWFLYILCWLYAGVLVLRRVVGAVDRQRVSIKWLDRLVCRAWISPFRSVLLAVPISAALFLQPNWVWWFGVPTPGYTLIPPAVPLFVYGYVFGLGWLLDRQRELLDHLGNSWLTRLLIGLAAASVCLTMAGPEASSTPINDSGTKLTYAASYGIALLSLTLSFIGLGVRFLGRASPVVRYVSDASYWMYIAHLPIVMALQTWLLFSELHWAIKFVTVNVATCFVLLLTYRYWVRSSWIGLMLNGRRHSVR